MKVLFALLFLCLPLYALDQAAVDKANQLYDDSISLIEGGDKSQSMKILTQLKEARELLLAQNDLTSELEDTLTKINSHIYWQTKFSSITDMAVTMPKKKKVKDKKEVEDKTNAGDAFKAESYKRWLAEKKVREERFKTSSQAAFKYEKSFSKDAHSNLLNFLDLQLQVVDPKSGLDILAKAKSYHDTIVAQDKALLDPVLSSIDQAKYFSTKDYEGYFGELVRKMKYGKFDAKTKKVLRQHAYEIQALSKMKSRLLSGITTKTSIEVPSSLMKNFDGVISKATRKGVELLSFKGKKSEIGWGVISEEAICEMCLKFMDQNNPDDLFMLVISNLRLSQYEKAYEYLSSLMKLDSKNYLRYRDFLAQCETGYRLKYGELFEKTFTRVEELSISGQVNQAFEIMNELMDNYLNSPLGQSYSDRFSFLYKGIIRA